MEEYKKYTKEYKNLSPVVDKYREYVSYQRDNEDGEEVLAEGDEDMRELAEEQIKTAKESMEACFEELRILLLPKDPNDDKNVIIEIRGGAGVRWFWHGYALHQDLDTGKRFLACGRICVSGVH